MAIDPKLVSIIPASELPTGVPTSAGQFFFYEGNEMKKAPMTEIYELVSGSQALGTITPSSTIPASGNVWGFAGEGTYPNAGNLTVSPDTLGILTRVDDVWSKVEVEMPSNTAKIVTWSASAYTSGSQVVHEGKIYEANAATVAGDVPGVSSKWVYKVGGITKDILFNTVPAGFASVTQDSVRTGQIYAGTTPALTTSSVADTYIYPFVEDLYITTEVDSSKTSLFFLDASKQPYPNSSLANFFTTGINTDKEITRSQISSTAKYIAFACLKTFTGVGVKKAIPASYEGQIKTELISMSKDVEITNSAPYGSLTMKTNFAEDATGAEIEATGFILYRLHHKLYNFKTLKIAFNSANALINVHNADGSLLSTTTYPSGVQHTIDLSALGGKYISFALSASASLRYFNVKYNKAIDDRLGIYNFRNYQKTDANNQLSDSVAFQALMDYVSSNGGGTIYVPAGIYNFITPITCKSNVSIVGDGENMTIFKPRGSLSAFIGSNINNATYRDFQIDGEFQRVDTSYTSSIKGIFQTYLNNVTYKNLLIKNTGATGLGCDFFINGLVENVRVENCGRLVDLTQTQAPGASGIGIGTGSFVRGNESLTIINCHANNCGQNGIFIERQYDTGDHAVGTSVIGCTAEGNRIGFGCSGNDNLIFIGCTAYNNHHAGFTYDKGTMDRAASFGKFVKYIGCISKKNGRNIPVGYPNYSGDLNGYGWYIKGNYNGIELTNCDSTENLKSGFHVKAGITNLYINGGRFASNMEHGIDLNGTITKFKIAPSVIESNTGDGLRINGNMNNGFVKDFLTTANSNGINKVTGTLANVLVKDVLAFSNVTSQSNITIN